MKVAVLDLATVFAKLFKPTASSSSSPSYSPAPGAPSPKVQPLLTASASALGAPSLPVRYAALASAGGTSVTSLAAAARAFPGGSGVGVGAAAPKPSTGGSCASGSSSPRSAREPGSWAAPASKPLLFVTLPDIGEEGAPDADPQEETAAPRQVEGPPDFLALRGNFIMVDSFLKCWSVLAYNQVLRIYLRFWSVPETSILFTAWKEDRGILGIPQSKVPFAGYL